ncbi:hypothetical protein BTZ20_2956 [Rhodococcus sp. MTM3W5.2]|nr:hypothetical protein BTZ20_2956 [Rhodococcus sp. MTM3W5.2]
MRETEGVVPGLAHTPHVGRTEMSTRSTPVGAAQVPRTCRS